MSREISFFFRLPDYDRRALIAYGSGICLPCVLQSDILCIILQNLVTVKTIVFELCKMISFKSVVSRFSFSHSFERVLSFLEFFFVLPLAFARACVFCLILFIFISNQVLALQIYRIVYFHPGYFTYF